MKILYTFVLFICSLLFASNAQAATKSFSYYGYLSSGQTKTHQLVIPYDGTLKLTVRSMTGRQNYIVAYVKNSGKAILGTGTSSSITTKPTAVSAGDSLTIEVFPAHLQSSRGQYYITCKLTYTPNRAPVVSSITASPSTTTYGNSVTVKVAASDADGNLSYVKFTKGSSSVNDTTSPYAHTYAGLAAGTHTVKAYAVDTKAASDDASVSFKINKATPSVSKWPTASTITYGQTLASSKLSGGKASVAGSFAWTSTGTKPTAGTRGYTVRFTPKDTANYNNPTHAVSVITNKATREVSVWPSASTITYGQTLASSKLTGGKASVSGKFTWVSSVTKPAAVGTYSYAVRFTPTDTSNYNTVTGTVSMGVRKATPAISKWPIASAIVYGQTLASSKLTGASANVSGSFIWTNSKAKPTTIGNNTYTVKFTPKDTKNYNSLTHSISIKLNKATPSISAWPSASGITYGQTLGRSKLNAGKANIGGSFAWTSSGIKPTIGTHSYTVRFSPKDSTHYNSVTHAVSVKTTADPNSDLDGDGITYAQELKLGTNPDVAAVSDSSNATKLSVF